MESADFSVLEESGYYEWLFQDLPLDNVGDPMAFADPLETPFIFWRNKAVFVDLMESEAGPARVDCYDLQK